MDAYIGSATEYLRLTFPRHFLTQGWGEVGIQVVVRGFTGTLQTTIDAQDLRRFAEELEALYATLEGQARFVSPDRQLEFMLASHQRGRMLLSGSVRSQPIYGNRLQFAVVLDQTCLARTLAQFHDLVNLAYHTA